MKQDEHKDRVFRLVTELGPSMSTIEQAELIARLSALSTSSIFCRLRKPPSKPGPCILIAGHDPVLASGDGHLTWSGRRKVKRYEF